MEEKETNVNMKGLVYRLVTQIVICWFIGLIGILVILAVMGKFGDVI